MASILYSIYNISDGQTGVKLFPMKVVKMSYLRMMHVYTVEWPLAAVVPVLYPPCKFSYPLNWGVYYFDLLLSMLWMTIRKPEVLICTRVFSKCTRMAIMPILASEALFHENKKISVTRCPSEYWTTGPLILSPTCSLYTNLAFACKTDTLSSLYSHVLLILTKSSKSKHQVVHEQKFKDLLSSTCQVSVERSLLDLESEVQWFNTHWGNIFLLEYFVFT